MRKTTGIVVAALTLASCVDHAEGGAAADARFLGPSAFAGRFVPRSSNTVTGGQSTFVGIISALNLPREEVRRLLPPELHLAKTIDPGVSAHPVLLLFGHQNDATTLSFGFPIPTFVSYRELILVVPFVQERSGTTWYSYATRMYLDFATAKQIGEDYGYKKVLARLEHSARGLEVRDEGTGSPIFDAETFSTGALSSDAAASAQFPAYRSLKQLLEMPIIGQKADRTYACSYFELDHDASSVMPVTLAARFHVPFTPEMGASWTDGVKHAVPDAAFFVNRVRWRLAWPPLSCGL